MANTLCPDCGIKPGSTVYTRVRTSLKVRCSTCQSLKLPEEVNEIPPEELEAAAGIHDLIAKDGGLTRV